MIVFVLDINQKPLMPCDERKARLLLKQNKAIIYSYKPFSIQLLSYTHYYIQDLVLAVDTGSKHIGFALRQENKILYTQEVSLRTDVSSNIKTKSDCRKQRRSRLRYRKKRFLNRRRKAGWLPPSLQSRVDNTINHIDKILHLLPPCKLILEVGNFDVAKILNPDISGKEYQQGVQLGYVNVKNYILARDNYKCQIPQCQTKDCHLHVHHIIFKSAGGTDKPNNLITLCSTHHKQLHNGEINPKFTKMKQYKEPPFMNSLKKRLMDYYSQASFCYGYETKITRQNLGLSKSHINDAIAISCYESQIEKVTAPKQNVFILQLRSKKRSLHEQTARKGRAQKNINQVRNPKNVKSVGEYHLGEQVNVLGQIGYISGFSQKSAYVKNLQGEYITLPGKSYKQISLTKLGRICYNNNWCYWNISESNLSHDLAHSA